MREHVLTWAAQEGAEQVDWELGHAWQGGSWEQQGVLAQKGLVQEMQVQTCQERMAGHHTDPHTSHQKDHPAQAGGPGQWAHALQVQEQARLVQEQEQGQKAQVLKVRAQVQQEAQEQLHCQWALAQNLLEQQEERQGH